MAEAVNLKYVFFSVHEKSIVIFQSLKFLVTFHRFIPNM